MAEECQTRVAELEQELERADQYVTEAAKDHKQMELETEVEKLQQLEDLCQQSDKERKRHRQEQELLLRS